MTNVNQEYILLFFEWDAGTNSDQPLYSVNFIPLEEELNYFYHTKIASTTGSPILNHFT